MAFLYESTLLKLVFSAFLSFFLQLADISYKQILSFRWIWELYVQIFSMFLHSLQFFVYVLVGNDCAHHLFNFESCIK